jgi:hypothetical protein
MADLGAKVRHVRAGAGGLVPCRWPGCGRRVPAAQWGCGPHWHQLPDGIRTAIWASYRPGQEADGRISNEYADAVRAAAEWIARGAAVAAPRLI